VLSFSFLRSVSFVLGVLLYFRVTPFVAAPVAVVSVCAILSCCRGSHTLVQPRQITSMLLNLPNPASVRTGSVDCAFCASVIDHLSYESFWSFSLRRFSSLHVAHFAARLARFGPTGDDLSPQRRAYDYFFFSLRRTSSFLLSPIYERLAFPYTVSHHAARFYSFCCCFFCVFSPFFFSLHQTSRSIGDSEPRIAELSRLHGFAPPFDLISFLSARHCLDTRLSTSFICRSLNCHGFCGIVLFGTLG